MAARAARRFTRDDLFAAQSEQYIAAHAGDSSPFYMQVNYTIPHFDIDQISSAPGGLGITRTMPWTTAGKRICRDDHAHGRERRLAHGEARAIRTATATLTTAFLTTRS